MKISVVISAYDEEERIGAVVQAAAGYADEVVVVDVGSTDGTAGVAKGAGACVIRLAKAGYIAAMKRGFHEASGDIVVTMDADAEHWPEERGIHLRNRSA